jgi:hypothetical protein
MGDGSVKFLEYGSNPLTFRGLITIRGGEVVSADPDN